MCRQVGLVLLFCSPSLLLSFSSSLILFFSSSLLLFFFFFSSSLLLFFSSLFSSPLFSHSSSLLFSPGNQRSRERLVARPTRKQSPKSVGIHLSVSESHRSSALAKSSRRNTPRDYSAEEVAGASNRWESTQENAAGNWSAPIDRTACRIQ